MNMPSINIQIIITLNSMHKGKTMSVQPVELSKAYRLLQVGSTTMISAKYDGVENVMSAAWLGWQASEKWWPISAPGLHTSVGGKERLFRGADPRSQPDGNRPLRWRAQLCRRAG
jgi:hypothetical protein